MPRRPFNVLVFDDHALTREQAVATLKQRDYGVLEAVVGDQARWWLSQWAVDLLVVGTRVGGASGLQFYSAARSHNPSLQCVLVGREGDQRLQPEAWRHGASLLIHPYDPLRFLAVVAVHLASIRQQQRWPRKPVRSRLPITVAGKDAQLLDVSYGGLKFAIAGESYDLPRPMSVEFPDTGLSVPAELIWSSRAQDGVSCICGAALTDDAPPTPWRRYIDQLALES